jgi:nicotinamidase-related amidase
MPNSSQQLRRTQAGLLVVDIQERLLPAMAEADRVLQNSIRLARGAAVLGLPIWVTEQYKKGLGNTLPELAGAIPGFAPVEKLAFSACGAEGLLSGLRDRAVASVILCGIEAHVCVNLTCLDLLKSGFNVFVVADATSSRSAQNHHIALDRMRHAGAVLCSTEMVLFELLERAGTEEFKEILKLVK